MSKLHLPLCLAVLFTASAAYGGPIAPKAEPPANASDPKVELAVQSLKDDRIPDEKEVGLPAYPGARVANVTEKAINGLNWIIILSEDPPEKVKAFYEGKLPSGWHSWERYGTTYFSPADPKAAELHEAPVMEIYKPFGSQAVLMPSAKTVMSIFYR